MRSLIMSVHVMFNVCRLHVYTSNTRQYYMITPLMKSKRQGKGNQNKLRFGLDHSNVLYKLLFYYRFC